MEKIISKSTLKPRLSIILPCLNEEEAIKGCLLEIIETIKSNHLDAEVLIVDNGSTDRSVAIIEEFLPHFPRLRLIHEIVLGYGSAYQRGIMEARGEYIFMADADGTYEFSNIPRFIKELEAGADLVVGNRFNMEMAKGSMPWHHKYIGNPLLSLLVKWFFKVQINDIHCGQRAISKKALNKIILYTSGMEFASEMIVKAAKANLNIREIPITYKERLGISKLNSLRDGWRHLRFILLYSPNILFFIPGIILFSLGLLSFFFLYLGKISIFGIPLYVHPVFLSSLFLICGYQLILFAGFARTYAITHLGDKDSFLEPLFKHITIEKAGFLGIILACIGVTIYIYIFRKWYSSGFGSLDEIKNSVAALTLTVLGIQTFFSAFMLSILGIKEK